MKPISARALLRGLWPHAPAGLTITAVVTDSREVVPGCLFVAIKGERVDGHDFAAAAFEGGAALVLAQRAIEGVPGDKLVIVPDVLDGMIRMGANYRTAFSPLILAITGSVGKTTPKEFAAAIFSAFGDPLKTEGNQNNEIGLPKTLFRLDETIRYAAIEMGMQGPGEIRKLTKAVRPDAAIITRIGYAHIEQLGSLENVLQAKLEVGEGLRFGSPLILNGDDPRLRKAVPPDGLPIFWAGIDNPENDVRADKIRKEAHGQVFEIVDRQFGRYETFIPALGHHNVGNALLAYTAATRLGLNAEQSAAALAAFQPAGCRLQTEESGGVTLIEDFYNAGPDSMRAALAVLADMEPEGRRVAVLGDMLELGAVSEEAHRALGEQAAKAGVELLVGVGERAMLTAAEAERRGLRVWHTTSNAEAARILQKEVRSGDAVLLKASRGMKFEEILQDFLAGR